jgi:DNA (cytosine-5)-methyltransferase 1
MGRPRLLDLFCGAGGCASGYARAGFDVVGVDHLPQPRYPFEFAQADALDYLAEHGPEYDVVHASPPCQRYSVAKNIGGAERHPDLVAPCRELLERTGKPFVIENVPGAPLISPVLVCGLALGLRVKRHRLFESNHFLFGTRCPAGHRRPYVTVFGHGSQAAGFQGKEWVTVFGGVAPKNPDSRRRASADVAKAAMGIDWMGRDELAQAIPPAYTEFIGRQLLRVLPAAD